MMDFKFMPIWSGTGLVTVNDTRLWRKEVEMVFDPFFGQWISEYIMMRKFFFFCERLFDPFSFKFYVFKVYF